MKTVLSGAALSLALFTAGTAAPAELPKTVTDPMFATNAQVLAAYAALTDLIKPHEIATRDQNSKPILDKDGKWQIVTLPYHFDGVAVIEALTRDKVALQPAAAAASDALALLHAQYMEKYKNERPALPADGKPDPKWNPLGDDPGFIKAVGDLMAAAPATLAFAPLPLRFADFNVTQNDGIADDIAALGPLVRYSDQAAK